MWLIRAALRRPITVLVAVIAVALTAVFAVSRMRADIFPDLDLPVIYVAQPYGGMSPAQMEGLHRLLLRVPLPLHQRHRERRIEVDSEHGPAEADVPSGHRHGRGAGADDRLRQSRARVHAAGHGRAVHHAVRRRHGAGRLSRVLERDAQPRRDSGPRAQPRAAAVRDAARADVAAAVRRQPAHDRRSASIPIGCARTACRPTR